MIRVACFAAALALLAQSSAFAGDRAQTAELPAALAAMNMQSSQVITRAEAQQVRGEGLLLLTGLKANANVKVNADAFVKAPVVGKVVAKADVNVKVNANVGVLGLVGGHGYGH